VGAEAGVVVHGLRVLLGEGEAGATADAGDEHAAAHQTVADEGELAGAVAGGPLSGRRVGDDVARALGLRADGRGFLLGGAVRGRGRGFAGRGGLGLAAFATLAAARAVGGDDLGLGVAVDHDDVGIGLRAGVLDDGAGLVLGLDVVLERLALHLATR